jgi:hypothetical protein
MESPSCFLKVEVNDQTVCTFFYSMDGENFRTIGQPFKAQKGRWIGAKVGLFNVNPNMNESEGFSDFDWFRVE